VIECICFVVFKCAPGKPYRAIAMSFVCFQTQRVRCLFRRLSHSRLCKSQVRPRLQAPSSYTTFWRGRVRYSAS